MGLWFTILSHCNCSMAMINKNVHAKIETHCTLKKVQWVSILAWIFFSTILTIDIPFLTCKGHVLVSVVNSSLGMFYISYFLFYVFQCYFGLCHNMILVRDHSGYELSQWEMELQLQCNTVSNWLSQCPEWPLCHIYVRYLPNCILEWVLIVCLHFIKQ